MKKLFLVLFVLGVHITAYAQVARNTDTISASSTACATAASCVNLNQLGGQTGVVAVAVTGTYSGTLQFEGTVDNNWQSVTCVPVPVSTTVTSTTSTGTWQCAVTGLSAFRVRASALASGIATVTLQGSFLVAAPLLSSTGLPVSPASAGGLPVTASVASGVAVASAICSGATCYTNPVNSGVVVIASGSSSTIFAQTTALDQLHCTNAKSTSVNLTATDGSNNYFIGPTFPIAGFNSFDAPAGMLRMILSGGIKMSASAASAINCWVGGRQ